ncbi:hypothetical protein BD560DRAFT_384212 [Blakeslea trispora]|nr:hypothetical protein BD560DRAFT_384212 [Blakeslea trispora]
MVYTKEFKEAVTLDYACYICKSILSKPAQVIQHVESVHGYRLPRRHVGHKRPLDPNYHFVGKNDLEEAQISHYACSSCWFHCPETGIAELADHVIMEHNPQAVTPSKPSKIYQKDISKNKQQEPESKKEGLIHEQKQDIPTDSKQESPNDTNLQRDLISKLSEVTELLKGLVMKQT